MQTFVPMGADFKANARVLDRQRLGKQRVEGMQILNTLLGESKGWRSHPIVKMWAGYEGALIDYVVAMCDEWVERGYKDTCKEKVLAYRSLVQDDAVLPGWLADEEVAVSHQANLVRKLPEHYLQFWPNVDPTLAYKWVT